MGCGTYRLDCRLVFYAPEPCGGLHEGMAQAGSGRARRGLEVTSYLPAELDQGLIGPTRHGRARRRLRPPLSFVGGIGGDRLGVSADAHQGPRLRCRRRLSAGQLQLPQLRRCAPASRRSRQRTQSCLAVSGDGRALDAAQRLARSAPADRNDAAALAPSTPAGRASPIAAIVLTNADVDHVAGLLSLREGVAFTLYASERCWRPWPLTRFSTFSTPPVPPGSLAARALARASLAGLTVEAFPVPGKVALYLEDAAGPVSARRTGDTHRASDQRSGQRGRFFYIPGCAAIDAPLAARLRASPLVLFDGTLYTDDGNDRARAVRQDRPAHGPYRRWPGRKDRSQPSPRCSVKRRVFVHMNNSNPVLREDSPERAEVERAGWEIACDGMEIRYERADDARAARGGDPPGRRRALPRQASLSPPAARRQA